MLDKMPPSSGFKTSTQGLGNHTITSKEVKDALGITAKKNPMLYTRLDGNMRTIMYLMHAIGVIKTTGPIPTSMWSLKLTYNEAQRDGMMIFYKKNKDGEETIARIFKIVIPKGFVCEQQTHSED